MQPTVSSCLLADVIVVKMLIPAMDNQQLFTPVASRTLMKKLECREFGEEM